MTLTVPSSALLHKVQSHYRVLAPLLVLCLARYVYHQRQRHLAQLKLHRAMNNTLGHKAQSVPQSSDNAAPIEEWHEMNDGSQVSSIVYHSLTVEPSNVLVLIIPGNPGVPHFSMPLMRELVHLIGRDYEVRCISQTGHFMPWKNNDRTFTFQEQMDHKVQYIQQRIKANPSLRLILIGHSIGSYISLKVAQQFPDRIEKIVLMQPTLADMAKTRQGRKLMPVFERFHHAVRVVTFLEYLTPLALRRWLVRLAIGSHLEDVIQQASFSIVNASVARNMLFMALHEMQQVCEFDATLVQPHEAKTLFVFSAIDEWVPGHLVQQYQTEFKKARHRVVSQEHAFMMEESGSKDMAAHIAQWIRNDIAASS